MQAAEKASRTQPVERDVRAAAILYVALSLTSIFAFFTPQSFIVPHDAAATAHNILASEALFRLSIVSGLISTILFVFLGRALYRLLTHVDKTQASLMVVLVLLSVPISFVSWLNEVAALRLIDGPALPGLATSQMDGLATLFLDLSSDTSALNAIFFGLWVLPLAVLVRKSGFIPGIFGYLLIIAGCSYLVGTLNFLLVPPFRHLVSSVATVGYAGELGVIGWLAVKAVQQQLRGANTLTSNDIASDSNLEGGNAW